MGVFRFIKEAVGIFSNRNDGVNLTREQAELVKGLIEKERLQISRQMHDAVDKGAIEGKTVSATSICKIPDNASPEERARIEQVMQELIDKYGENIPVNTMHRLSREWGGEEKTWGDNPGCNERQLQRRDGSPLFPVERRIVTIGEILDAQERDRVLQKEFKIKFGTFIQESKREMKTNNSLGYLSYLLQETQSMIEEASAISGDIGGEAEELLKLEELLINSLNDAMPDGAERLKEAQNMSYLSRMPFIALSTGKHRTIPDNEVVPSLLAEDLKIINFIGSVSRSFGPDFRPRDADIRSALDKAVDRDFSKQRAAKILAAWVGYA